MAIRGSVDSSVHQYETTTKKMMTKTKKLWRRVRHCDLPRPVLAAQDIERDPICGEGTATGPRGGGTTGWASGSAWWRRSEMEMAMAMAMSTMMMLLLLLLPWIQRLNLEEEEAALRVAVDYLD